MTTSERDILVNRQIRLNLEQDKRLKVLSKATGVPQTALIRRFVDAGLEKEEENNA